MAEAYSPPPSNDESTIDDLDSRASESTAPDDTVETALLDEEENPVEVGEADTVKTPSKEPFRGGYNALKSHEGQLYSGMAIGGSHTWNYEPGLWKETKEEPDRWRIDYQTNKRRTRNAPKGSGAPVGTEYHWLIVGHQHVRKVDANTYETHLTGSKYKLAHKSVSSGSWSIPTVKDQREREVELLDDAQRRVKGLPPVLASEKVKMDQKEKGQQSLDALFRQAGRGKSEVKGTMKRKRR